MWVKNPVAIEIPEDAIEIKGSARERGERFIHAFMDGLQADSITIKVGFGVGMGSYEDQVEKLTGVVVAEVNEGRHFFTIHEAKAMADSMERTMQKMPFPDERESDLMQNAIMALRESAKRLDGADLEALAKDSGMKLN